MKLRIVTYPHPALRCRARPVDRVSANTLVIADEMFQLMYAGKGVGLAAPQVGLPFQLLVLNLSGDRRNRAGEKVYLNPTIVRRRGIQEDDEGCLSLPGLFGPVRRALSVVVRARELSGREVEIHSRRLAARVWQHEIDHLSGILFIDRLSATTSVASAGTLVEWERTFRQQQAQKQLPPDEEIARELIAHLKGPGIPGGPDEASRSR